MSDFQTTHSSCASSLAQNHTGEASLALGCVISLQTSIASSSTNISRSCSPPQPPALTALQQDSLSLPCTASVLVSSSHLMHKMEMLELVQGVGTLHPQPASQFTEANI